MIEEENRGYNTELKFKFNLPEENSEFQIQTKSLDYYCALDEISNYCRIQMKHGDVSEETYNHLERVRDLIPEMD